jgi:hypothetical protein
MTRTDRLVALGATFLLAYVAVLVWNGPESTEEAFPVFNWSLFSEMPDPILTDYSLRFTSANGEVLEEPVFFEEARRLLPTAFQRPDAYLVIQQLGSSIANDQPYRFATTKNVLDDRWLAELASADYEIVRRTFDIRERARCDCYTDVEVLRVSEIER